MGDAIEKGLKYILCRLLEVIPVGLWPTGDDGSTARTSPVLDNNGGWIGVKVARDESMAP